jgi:hypothetical protein
VYIKILCWGIDLKNIRLLNTPKKVVILKWGSYLEHWFMFIFVLFFWNNFLKVLRIRIRSVRTFLVRSGYGRLRSGYGHLGPDPDPSLKK